MYLILNKTEQYVETWDTGYPLKRIEELLFQRNEIVVISTGSNTIKYPELKEEYITELDNGTSIEDAKEMYMGVYGEMYINDDTVEINSRNAFPFVFPDYYDGDKDRKVTVEEYFNRHFKKLEENKSIDDKKIILMQSKRINELTEQLAHSYDSGLEAVHPEDTSEHYLPEPTPKERKEYNKDRIREFIKEHLQEDPRDYPEEYE